ncbi:NTP transferase domain-containing protein [Candidatus Uhrbacteria bacterium]|nr:NTP transferase domain-containing protein [Candidatus Uhrbacteria bacterium]
MIKSIILAAGLGIRMQAELPKVLVTLFDKPLVRFVIEAVQTTPLGKPLVVIGHQSDMVREVLGEEVEYAYQGNILGTGHAVAACRDAVDFKYDNVLVLYGDMPFISADTIMKLKDLHEKSGAVLSMCTTSVSDYKDWRQSLHDYGRIIRNLAGQVSDVVEVKDANDSIRATTEVNPSFFCFQTKWLWENIVNLNNNNAKGEYYLTDLVGFAFKQKQKIATMEVNPLETVGVNTPEHLLLAESLLQKRLVRST